MIMDYGAMVGEYFAYAKDAVWERWNRWVMLIIATILLGIPLMGYIMKVLRGTKPAPEVDDWGTLFIDGIKYIIVKIIYAIPLIIVGFLVLGAAFMTAMSGNIAAMTGAIAGMLAGVLIILILAIIIALFEIIGMVRFARTGSIGEAFNFNAILATIGKIGWVSYIIALIVFLVVAFVIGIIIAILTMIPIIGWIIYFCLIAPMAIFFARYICLVYDSAGA
jgi:hypothetical protein